MEDGDGPGDTSILLIASRRKKSFTSRLFCDRIGRIILILRMELVNMAEKKPKSEFLTYKGKPLVRSGNTLYYGNMFDKYVIMIQIVDTKKVGELEVANNVIIQLMFTDPELRTRDRVVKKSENKGLYNAMDLGAIWLERALAE